MTAPSVRDRGSGAASEILTAFGRCRRPFASTGLLSVLPGSPILTNPQFVLQVYDRVPTPRFEATSAGLAAIITFLFGSFTFHRLLRAPMET